MEKNDICLESSMAASEEEEISFEAFSRGSESSPE